jgi:hypothetical protein
MKHIFFGFLLLLGAASPSRAQYPIPVKGLCVADVGCIVKISWTRPDSTTATYTMLGRWADAGIEVVWPWDTWVRLHPTGVPSVTVYEWVDVPWACNTSTIDWTKYQGNPACSISPIFRPNGPRWEFADSIRCYSRPRTSSEP